MATVDIEWVGDPEVLDEVTKFRIQMGEIHPMAATVVRSADIQRTQRVKGITKRVVDPDYFPGLSRAYTWGPDTFVTPVDDEDVDIILGDPGSGHQFRRWWPGIEDEGIIRPDPRILEVGEPIEGNLVDVYR
jgi:hypothetical protein